MPLSPNHDGRLSEAMVGQLPQRSPTQATTEWCQALGGGSGPQESLAKAPGQKQVSFAPETNTAGPQGSLITSG